MTNIDLPQASGGTEWKVKAATWAAFLVSLAGTTALEWTATDLVPALPNSLNWLVPIASSIITAGLTWFTGWSARTKPDNISQSTVDAIREWMRKRAQRGLA
jgi:hypothetical protein